MGKIICDKLSFFIFPVQWRTRFGARKKKMKKNLFSIKPRQETEKYEINFLTKDGKCWKFHQLMNFLRNHIYAMIRQPDLCPEMCCPLSTPFTISDSVESLGKGFDGDKLSGQGWLKGQVRSFKGLISLSNVDENLMISDKIIERLKMQIRSRSDQD